MKILIVSDTYYPHINGASYFTTRFSQALVSAGHTVYVICPSTSFSYTLQTVGGVKVYGLPSITVTKRHNFRITIPIGQYRKVTKIIKDINPDVIHVQMHFAIVRLVLLIAKKLNIPVMGTNHFMPENVLPLIPFHSLLKRPLTHLAWKDFARALSSLQRVTAPTRAASAMIQPYFSTAVVPISCGIDTQQFKPGPREKEIEEKYTLKDVPRFLFVGRLDEEKNLEVVVRAAACALKASTFQLIIAGNGSERGRLQRLSEELSISEYVVFTGFVPDEELPKLYRCADAFIMAGTAELQSIVTMEAMASGLPIVAADAVALPELVETGANGYLFPPSDVGALAEVMVMVLSDPELRVRMGAKSLQRIAEHSIDSTVAKFEQLYSEVSTST